MPAPSTTATLLVADPLPLARLGLTRLFAECNEAYELCETPDEAALLAALGAAPFNGVIVAASLPCADGIATLLLRLRHLSPNLPVVVLFDDSTDEATLLQLLRAGCNGLLHRAAPLQDVCDTLHLVLHGGRCYDEHVTQLLQRQLSAHRPVPATVAFTQREVDVLRLLGEDLTSAAVAERLCLSPRTVEFHRHQMLQKTGIRTTLGLVLFAVRQGVFEV
jgi:DNA-binding NarL/FixJ family response regulator